MSHFPLGIFNINSLLGEYKSPGRFGSPLKISIEHIHSISVTLFYTYLWEEYEKSMTIVVQT